MQKIFNIIVIVLIVTLLGVVLYQNKTTSKTAYVDTIQLFNQFELRKELEKNLTQLQATRANILDSLELTINSLGQALQQETKPNQEKVLKFQQLREQYFQKQEQFEADYQKLSQQYNEQVWSRINQYMEEYGKEHDYIYLYGANGSGALMYADKTNNITEEVVNYINLKYQGKKSDE